MTNQSYDLNPTDPAKKARERAATNRTPTLANLPAVVVPTAASSRPAVSTHQCPNCGAWAPTGTSICTECGTRLQVKPQKIRCRLCGANASTSLVICPHCGRELHPAPSRVLSWGAPAVLILLFLLVLVQRWESGNPLQWVRAQFTSGQAWVTQIAQQLDPQITISTLPDGGVENRTTGLVPAPPALPPSNTQLDSAFTKDMTVQSTSLTQVTASNQASTQQVEPPATNQAVNALHESAGMTLTVATSEPTATATTQATPVEPTATALPSPQPTSTALAPTATATTQATPTKAAATATSAVVQVTPTVNTVDAIVAANLVLTKTEAAVVTILQPTTTAVPTETPTPTPAAVTYAVQAGDTPLGIALQFGIEVDELLAMNGLTLDDARRIRVGQELVIATKTAAVATPLPTATSMPTSAPTVAPTATASATNPPPPTVTYTPTATTRVDAPALRSPEAGAFLSCGNSNDLVWLPVAYIRDSDRYLLHLGFLNGYNGDGSEQVIWILEQWRPANVTLWELDEGLCGLAPQAFGRQWRWYVEVVEAAGSSWQPVSPPSTIWGFSWN